MTSSGRSGETPRWDCRASSRTKTRLRSIGAIRWLSSGSSMTPASLSSTLPRVRPASRRSSSIQLGSQEPSPIMSNSRAISSSRSAPPTGSATWRHSRQAGPATISSRSSRTRSTRLADKRLPWGFGWLRHPHIWGPMEREHEVRRVIELTDPKCVWLTTDTGHLTLGGMDAVRIMGDYFPRIAEVHLKDTYAKFRGNTSTADAGAAPNRERLPQSGRRRRRLPGGLQAVGDRHYRGSVVGSRRAEKGRRRLRRHRRKHRCRDRRLHRAQH